MPIQAKLEHAKVAEHTWNFNLNVSGKIEHRFYLARIKNGSMILVNYEINKDGKRCVLSVFFYVNIMGHDFDQWIHFELKTGKQIPNYVCPHQGTGKYSEIDRFAAQQGKQIAVSFVTPFCRVPAGRTIMGASQPGAAHATNHSLA